MRFLLLPFSWIYSLITYIRNICFDIGIFPSTSFKIPIISVGNLSMGGEGKTPHVEYIITILQNKYKIAVLSRGYGRNTNGFIAVNILDDYKKVGDEPLQLKNKFPDCLIAVCESRKKGINQILSEYTDIDVIILDDAFQHRWVNPGLNILITSYQIPFYKNNVLPAGTLREGNYAKKRADIIIMSKCPKDINNIEKESIIKKLVPLKKQDIFFSYIKYSKWNPIFRYVDNDNILSSFKKIILITGIVYAKNIKHSLEKQGFLVEHIEYNDHHEFKKENILKILEKYNSEKSFKTLILTTEKDAVRLKRFKTLFKNIPVYSMPIEIKCKNEEMFKNQIISYVKTNNKN